MGGLFRYKTYAADYRAKLKKSSKADEAGRDCAFHALIALSPG